MHGDDEVVAVFPRYLKLWYTTAIALFLLALLMSNGVVPRIAKGQGVWFVEQGERVHTHILMRHGVERTLEVDGTEKALLVVAPWLNWCTYGVMLGAVGAHLLRGRARGPGEEG